MASRPRSARNIHRDDTLVASEEEFEDPQPVDVDNMYLVRSKTIDHQPSIQLSDTEDLPAPKNTSKRKKKTKKTKGKDKKEKGDSSGEEEKKGSKKKKPMSPQ